MELAPDHATALVVHDFGAVQVHGHTVFFKIDTYDRNLRYHSPDPADPAVTCRVMTLMLARSIGARAHGKPRAFDRC